MISVRASKPRLAVLPLAAFAALAAMSATDPAASRRGEPEQRDYTVTRPAGPPILALVSLTDQRVTIYDAEGPILQSPVSSGQTSYDTPVGIYSVLQKEAEHYSNRYDDAAMPFMQRITWTGIAFHGGALPGYPASHGCVRLPHAFAERLFGMTKLGLRVIVSRYDVAPVPISHALLFKPALMASTSGLLTKAATTDATDAMRLGVPGPADEPPVVATRAAALQAIAAAKTAEAEEAARTADAARLIAKQKSGERARAQKALRIAETMKKRAEEDVADADRALGKARVKAEAATANAAAKLAEAEQKEKAEAADANAAAKLAEARAKLEAANANVAAKLAEAQTKLEAAKDTAVAKLAEAQAKFEAVRADAQPKIDDYQKAVDAAKAAEATKTALLAQARDAERKLKPVSVFISRATQKLYVRQAFEPIFEVPVTIAEADKPIGTHTYTAVDFADGGSAMRWNVVSIGGRRADDSDDEGRRNRRSDYDDDDDDEWRYSRRSTRRSTGRSAEPAPTDAAAAGAALDRISIPQETVDRISELLLPGSSLIVSDEPAHKETGKQTDFVVLISGEPQGGIKLRPKPRPEYYDDFYWGDGYGRRRGRDGGGYRGPVFQFW